MNLLPALFGALIITGLAGAGAALRPRPPRERPPRRPSRLAASWTRASARTKTLLVASLAGGVAAFLVTGWVAALAAPPALALGLPYLLGTPKSARQIARVEAMAEWTRTLAGVLGVGVGLEQAITATLPSTPDPIRPEVAALVARLRARWESEAALRAFADDLDDVTGDLVAADLILASRSQNRALRKVLEGIADSVAEDVASRRRLEAGRAKPRGTARFVTGFSLVFLGVLAISGDYVAPYRTPLGQVILTVLLAGYAGALWWMRAMAEGAPLPRILGAGARAEAS